jgi:hypothetical protein
MWSINKFENEYDNIELFWFPNSAKRSQADAPGFRGALL